MPVDVRRSSGEDPAARRAGVEPAVPVVEHLGPGTTGHRGQQVPAPVQAPRQASAPPPPRPDDHVRIGDAERQAVDARLQRAVGRGEISLVEYDERAREVWATRTRGELARVLADLPTEPGQAAPPAAAPGRRRKVGVALMSQTRHTGPVAANEVLYAGAVMGEHLVDLSNETLPPVCTVRAVAVMGSVQVRVPPGTRVVTEGFAVMGSREVKTLTVPDGAPVVHLQGYALMGGVEVTDGSTSKERRQSARAVVDLAKHPQRRSGQPDDVAEHYRLAAEQRVAAKLGRKGERHGHGRRRGLLPVLVVGALVIGGVVAVDGLAHGDDLSAFGSNVVTVQQGQTSVGALQLFGSATVVVPNDARVVVTGHHVFGSVENDVVGGAGPTVTVRADGAFGSIKIETVDQQTADRASHSSD